MLRKIAAIMVADVVGYSRLVADAEEATIARVLSYRETFNSRIVQYGGRIFNTAGDAVLAEFPSAVEALRATVEIQLAVAKRNSILETSRQIRFRIGVTIGDVIESNGDLFGDAVNVAARLEALADPSGICVSSNIVEQVGKNVSVTFDDMGFKSVKNIPRAVHVYKVIFSKNSLMMEYAPSQSLLIRQDSWFKSTLKYHKWRLIVPAIVTSICIIAGVYAFYLYRVSLLQTQVMQAAKFIDALQNIKITSGPDQNGTYTASATPANAAGPSILAKPEPAITGPDARLWCYRPTIGFDYLHSIQMQKEIAAFVTGFNQNRYNFNWDVNSAEEAATELHFGRGFQSAYGLLDDEIIEHSKNGANMNVNELMPFLSAVAAEEKFIDGLSKSLHADTFGYSTVYLRALEQGQCHFPIDNFPDALVIINQLSGLGYVSAKPSQAAVDNFTKIYNNTVDFMRQRLAIGADVKFYRVVSEWRNALIASAKL